jgi:hypothetical protein
MKNCSIAKKSRKKYLKEVDEQYKKLKKLWKDRDDNISEWDDVSNICQVINLLKKEIEFYECRMK